MHSLLMWREGGRVMDSVERGAVWCASMAESAEGREGCGVWEGRYAGAWDGKLRPKGFPKK